MPAAEHGVIDARSDEDAVFRRVEIDGERHRMAKPGEFGRQQRRDALGAAADQRRHVNHEMTLHAVLLRTHAAWGGPAQDEISAARFRRGKDLETLR